MLKFLHERLIKLSRESFNYFLSFLLILLALISIKLFDSLGSTVILWLSLITLEIGFFIYLVPIIRKLGKSTIGKVTIGLASIVGSAFSMSFAGQIINGYLEVTTTPFIYTQTIVSVLLLPLVFSVIFGFISIFALPVIMMLFMLNDIHTMGKRETLISEKKETNGILLISRFLAFIVLIGLSWSFNNNNSWFTDSIGGIAKWHAFYFEMDKFSHCSLEKNEKASYINKDDIVIGAINEQKISFRTGVCLRN